MKATLDNLKPGMRVEREGVAGVVMAIPDDSALALVRWGTGARAWVQIESLTIVATEAAR